MGRTWSKRSLRALKDVHPKLRAVLDLTLHRTPFDFMVTEGLRTLERQKKLKAAGKSQTLNSNHLRQIDGYAHAVDLMPVGDLPYPTWDIRNFEIIWAWMQTVCKDISVRVRWGGNWKSFKDGPHFELTGHYRRKR